MPRYYCDYCDTYLTHDSPSVRKQHNAGYKHKANVRSYYQQFEEQQTQSLIDQKVKEHLGQTAAFQQQVGAAFHQHLAALQTGPQRPRLPVLPPPTLPVPGSAQALSNQLLLPTVRPPVLPRPTTSAPGYSTSLGMAPTIRPPGAPVTSPPGIAQPNGLPRSPALTPPAPVATALRPATSTSASAPMTNGLMSAPALSGAPVSYQNQQTNSVPTSGGYGTYNYPASSSSFSQQSTSSVPPNSAYAAQQPPRVPPLLAPVHSTASTPLSSASAQDGYLYSQAPVSANPGNQSVLNSVGPPRGLSDF